ncbi:MAG: hypothetical protein J6N19_03020 [Clostridium sp.]|nr:hypothetical protein [Clostridium sp.]
MIDVETDVFNYVAPFASAKCAPNGFTSTFVPNPTRFPCASLVEKRNATDTRRKSSAEDEDFAVVTYEANAFAEDKFACRELLNEIDTQMMRLGFNCLVRRWVENQSDPNIFRMIARYTGTVDRRHTIYRRR